MKREHELHRRRRGRNLGLLVALLGLAGLTYWVTVSKIATYGLGL